MVPIDRKMALGFEKFEWQIMEGLLYVWGIVLDAIGAQNVNKIESFHSKE